MGLPQFLYKYEPFDACSLRNLKGQIVHFGSPLNFNDPYDCALTPDMKSPTDDEVETMRHRFLDELPAGSDGHKVFAAIGIEELRQKLVQTQGMFHDLVGRFLKERGVACFSEVNDSLLMWSHYGGRYQGFCLEFDSRVFAKAIKVRYELTIPPIDLSKFVLDDKAELIEHLFCTKSESWSYEREWRVMHVQAGTEYGYPAEALTGVYFGPDIDDRSLEIVCLILRGQNESVRFYRGSRSKSEFRVKFEEITYQSYLQAKKAGLRP